MQRILDAADLVVQVVAQQIAAVAVVVVVGAVAKKSLRLRLIWRSHQFYR